jgi:argininosuccinate synthase
MREWTDMVGKIISESQNVEAAKAQIKLEEEILKRKQREFNVYTDTLGTMGHDKFYYDPEIKSRVSRKMKIIKENEAKGLVSLRLENGSEITLDKEKDRELIDELLNNKSAERI